MTKKNKNSTGLSFVEAIISVAIFSLILLAFIYVYDSYTKVYNYQETLVTLATAARSSANEIQNISLQASNIISSHSFSGTTYTTDADTLVLKIPSIDDQGDTVDDKYDYAAFYVSGNSLYEKIEADGDSSRSSVTKQLSENLQSISLTYNNSDLSLANKITANFSMQKITRRQTVSYTLDQEIYIRNL